MMHLGRKNILEMSKSYCQNGAFYGLERRSYPFDYISVKISGSLTYEHSSFLENVRSFIRKDKMPLCIYFEKGSKIDTSIAASIICLEKDGHPVHVFGEDNVVKFLGINKLISSSLFSVHPINDLEKLL